MSEAPNSGPRSWWPALGKRVLVGSGALGIVVEYHPINQSVRLHMLKGLDDYGTTAWFDPELCEVIE